MSLYRILDEEEEKEFRQWARDNFDPGHETINMAWHPVVQDECHKMNDEAFTRFGNAMNNIRG